MLTKEQVSFFDAFGFLVLPQLFSPDEMAVIDREFEQVMRSDRAGESFRGDKRHSVAACAEINPALRRLIDDDRIYGAIEDLLGHDLMWLGSDGNYYVGDTAWHSDGTVMDMSRIKVALYLDPVGRDTGCLRFIPGSHRIPMHDDLQPLRVERTRQTIMEGRNVPGALDEYREKGIDVDSVAFDTTPEKIPAYPVESRPGDVVMFHQNLYHASFGGKEGRRMFTLCYATVPETPGAIAHVKGSYEGTKESIRALSYSDRDWVHHRDFLKSDRPRIQALVAPLKRLGIT